MKIKKILFCIATNGKKVKKTNFLIKSILLNKTKSNIEVKINLCGCVEPFSEERNVNLIDAKSDADNGMLSKLRLLASKDEDADVFVFVDDDFIFPPYWIKNLISYTQQKEWSIVGNKILLPNGHRFWDRCTRKPHRMVPYSHDENDETLYQTGGFWVISRECFNNLKWNPSIPINADRKGFAHNEDVEMSIRAYNKGFKISFDENNTVWHNDLSYIQTGQVISRAHVNFGQYNFNKEFLEYLKQIHESEITT
tara:strand:+ start:174 stop:932 length:759 start_codon:yes stop_codon:yes gene_type:complete